MSPLYETLAESSRIVESLIYYKSISYISGDFGLIFKDSDI